MKKFILPVAAALLSVAMFSCGPSSATDYAEENVKLQIEYYQAKVAGDDSKAESITEKGKKLEEEINKKCEEDAEFKKAYEEAYDSIRSNSEEYQKAWRAYFDKF